MRRCSRVIFLQPLADVLGETHLDDEERITTMRKGMLTTTATTALAFVLLIGIVNLFADFTYEGGRSIMGPFLGTLGASATVVGVVAGFGELLGYSLRSVSGFLADKTHNYWIVTFVGYTVNMLAVPALALAGIWPVAAALMIAERNGRAIRRPAVETMLSSAGQERGFGWVFGLNEALDQGGATVGPLVVALVLFLRGSYRNGFVILLISALLCLGTLAVARLRFPHPQELEHKAAQALQTRGFSHAYWLYVAAGALIAAGFADFSLIAFHFQQAGSVPATLIPVWSLPITSHFWLCYRALLFPNTDLTRFTDAPELVSFIPGASPC